MGCHKLFAQIKPPDSEKEHYDYAKSTYVNFVLGLVGIISPLSRALLPPQTIPLSPPDQICHEKVLHFRRFAILSILFV